MKKSNLTLLILLFSVLSIQIPARLNDPIEKISIVEVRVPSTEVYDDGIYRKLYSSFQIFSEDGNKLLGVSEKFDRPSKIRLKEGKYTFVVRLQNGDLLERDYAVEGNKFEVIRIN